MTILEITLFLAVIYNLVLVVIVLLKNTHRAGLTFAWYILGTAAWTACIAFSQILPEKPMSLWLIRAAHVSAAVIGISWIWFCAQFPQPSLRFRKVAVIFTIAGIPWLILPWGTWMIADVSVMSWGVEAVPGPLLVIYTAWIIIGMGAGMLNMAMKQGRIRGLERLQVRYILLGGVGLLATGSFFNLILPLITHSFRYGAPMGPLASIFVTTTTTYAIVRYRLMDIKIVLRAGLIYSVTIGTLSLLFAMLVPLLNTALTEHLHFPKSTGSFIMAFLIALAFQPLRRYVQHHVDRHFFKSVYDYRVTLREAGTALASARDQDILVETLVSALWRTLRPAGIAVYLPGHNSQFVQVTVTGEWNDLPETIEEAHPILKYALDADEVLLAEELIRQPEPHRSQGLYLRLWEAYVLLPLIAGDQMCGIVLLGEKRSGDIYSTDDLGLLRILGKQAAIALDNARHYHDMVMMNEYHARLLHIMQDGVIALDPEQKIITFNSAAERITSVPATRALGRQLDAVGLSQLPTTITDDHALEVTITMQDGREVPLLVTVTPFTRHLDVTASHLIVFRDLSALRALEQEKMQAERFSSMGAMAASLAHEIKNPLVPIQLFAHMLPTKFDDAEFREEFSQTVLNEVQRINRLIGQMLDLVHKPADDRAAVDMQELLERMLVLIRPECERNHVRVHRHIDADAPEVHGAATQLYQALLNVLTNAVQVMPDGGDLTLTARRDGEKFVCTITDTGPGVPQQDLRRIFEPLYTTKTGGHGLGLALTYQFIRAHGGEIIAECQPGTGLTVTITLPALCPAETEMICS